MASSVLEAALPVHHVRYPLPLHEQHGTLARVRHVTFSIARMPLA